VLDYLDSRVVTYPIETQEPRHLQVRTRLLPPAGTAPETCVSDRTRPECRAGPLMRGDSHALAEYRESFATHGLRRAAREAAAEDVRRAAMSEAMRRIDEFRREFAARAEQLRGGKENPHGVYHGKARELARLATDAADWSAEEKRAAADAIEEWLPKVVRVELKDERKNLKLAALRGSG